MQKISSRDNPRIKQAKKVRDSVVKDAIFIEGLRLAEEVLRSGIKIFEVFFSRKFAQTKRLENFLRNLPEQNLFEVEDKIFDSLGDTKNSQGIVLICEKPTDGRKKIESAFENKFEKIPLVVLLHEINNPANQGAILRTGEAAGVTGVILTKNSADVFSPKALRGSMGAVLRMPIWSNADFSEVINWAQEKNLISICADVNSKKSYLETDWTKPRLLIFGSEAHGLSVEERGLIDENLIIPMENQVESLNLAVSCGIILFEAKRQKLLS